jgi:hypothetical protein
MASGFTVVTNTTKHSTPMANVARLKTSFMSAPIHFPLRAEPAHQQPVLLPILMPPDFRDRHLCDRNERWPLATAVAAVVLRCRAPLARRDATTRLACRSRSVSGLAFRQHQILVNWYGDSDDRELRDYCRCGQYGYGCSRGAGIFTVLPLRCFDRAGEAAISLLAGHGAEQSDQPLRRSPRIYYFSIKEAPESGSNSYPPCAISRARGVMTQQEIEP